MTKPPSHASQRTSPRTLRRSPAGAGAFDAARHPRYPPPGITLTGEVDGGDVAAIRAEPGRAGDRTALDRGLRIGAGVPDERNAGRGADDRRRHDERRGSN